jgi:predicted TPR repeat methyltransferase
MANARLPHDLEAAREAASLRPNSALLALAYGEALLHAGRLPEAIAELQRALRLDYTFADARFALGCAWLEAGEPDKALESFSHLEEDESVAAKIAEAEAIKARSRSDAGYVRHLFDQFSIDYDARMIRQLIYRAPQILRELADLVMAGRDGLSILDLGCGTGLSGAAFADLACRLDGVDLSPAMIEMARARNIYDTLSVADIETHLASGDTRYDLILAADTLVYLGDLEPIFEGAARCVLAGGFFLFTVERKEGDSYELGPKRRWRHSEAYLRHQAARTGFDVAGLVACAPRKEGNVPVEGLAVALSRIV